MSTPIARLVSIAGHPLPVLALALLLPMAAVGAAGTAGAMAGLTIAGTAVMGWSWWRVRQGRWAHVDASRDGERRDLNRFLLPLLAIGTLLALPDPALARRLAMAAAIVAVALLTTRLCKLSLHAAFAAYATVLLWAWQPVAGLAMAALTVAVAASRLALRRHTPRDVVAGTLAGALAGWWPVIGGTAP
ncbi:phosphatase PAP2 family protein [Luteimonas abyssi]|uniref:phosphatase PAP2 family protein n=1 Tax=Luteimonas abyssi TaxID=1247514 RepID=UPI000737CFCB|nr:phosphatase PAP2 family protein [Luteimonas abyssi]